MKLSTAIKICRDYSDWKVLHKEMKHSVEAVQTAIKVVSKAANIKRAVHISRN